MKLFQSAPATEWRPKIAHGETVGFNFKTDQASERGERNLESSIFCRPIRGWNVLFAVRPTVSPWATFSRSSGALAALILFFAIGATAQTTNLLSDAEIQGRALAQKILEQWPAENSTNHGLVKIKHREDIPIVFQTQITETNWISRYQTGASWLTIIRAGTNANQYRFHAENGKETELSGSETMHPFAGSDFWAADLGLEFFHWPAQKVLPNPTSLKLGRSYTLLESTSPFTNGYSRVLTWIDMESYGILEAEAYDAKGELLKEFYPKNFKKVNGQYQVESMDMINHQTDSRTRLEFDLKK